MKYLKGNVDDVDHHFKLLYESNDMKSLSVASVNREKFDGSAGFI